MSVTQRAESDGFPVNIITELNGKIELKAASQNLIEPS